MRPGLDVRRWPTHWLTGPVRRAFRAWSEHRAGYPATTTPVPLWPAYAVASFQCLDFEHRLRERHLAARPED